MLLLNSEISKFCLKVISIKTPVMRFLMFLLNELPRGLPCLCAPTISRFLSMEELDNKIGGMKLAYDMMVELMGMATKNIQAMATDLVDVKKNMQNEFALRPVEVKPQVETNIEDDRADSYKPEAAVNAIIDCYNRTVEADLDHAADSAYSHSGSDDDSGESLVYDSDGKGFL